MHQNQNQCENTERKKLHVPQKTPYVSNITPTAYLEKGKLSQIKVTAYLQ